MNTPRFNREFTRVRVSRSRSPNWIRVRDVSDIGDSKSSGRKRIFAMVSPPARVGVDTKAIRKILIFDNHPATLRLLHDVDAAREERRKICYAILAIVLTIILIGALLWPLL